MTPRVSICIPVFNGADTLSESIRSAQEQHFEDYEILVTDDGSTDGSTELIRSIMETDARIALHVNPDTLGLAGNWNRCLELAGGTWVKFLFQDDLLHPDCLRTMVAASDDVDLVVCHRRAKYDGPSRQRRREYASYHRWASLRYLLGGDATLTASETAELVTKHLFVNVLAEPVSHLVRRDAALERSYDPDLVQLPDYDLAIRLALRRGFRYVDKPLATFRVHSSATTVTNVAQRRFALEAIDPAVLACRFLSDPGYEPLRAWAMHTGFDLGEVLEQQLGEVEARLPEASPDEREQWQEVLDRNPSLAAAWNPPHQRRPSLPPPRLRARLRAWARRGGQAARRGFSR